MKDSRTTHRAAMGLWGKQKDKVIGGKQKGGSMPHSNGALG